MLKQKMCGLILVLFLSRGVGSVHAAVECPPGWDNDPNTGECYELNPPPAAAPPLIDWSAETTAIKSELSPALSAGMSVGFLVLAVALGYRLFRRFVH
jgi:hypothetical protein